jgi:hypothetical protein
MNYPHHAACMPKSGQCLLALTSNTRLTDRLTLQSGLPAQSGNSLIRWLVVVARSV